MPKASEVKYWPSRKAYGTWIQGRQIILEKGPKDEPTGPTYRAALKRFSEEMELAAVAKPGAVLTVKAVLETYFRDNADQLAPNSVQIRRLSARLFIDRFPGLLINELAAEHVKTFIREGRVKGANSPRSKPWGPTTCRIRRESLVTMFLWAVDEGLLPSNPFTRRDRERFTTRARDRIVTPDEHQRVLTFLNNRTHHKFTSVVIALENTGARISELISARVQDWRDDIGAIVYYSDQVRRKDEYRHKNAAKKDRVIFFTGEALGMVRWLIEHKRPEDHIFTGRRGNRFTLSGCVCNFYRIGQGIGCRHITAHAYRHTFATRWLSRDSNIDQLAECLGNTPETIRRTYSHLLKDPIGLRAKLESVMRPQTEIRP
jgi:integrase